MTPLTPATDGGVPAELLETHRAAYESFMRFVKFGVIAIVVLLVLLAIFLL